MAIEPTDPGEALAWRPTRPRLHPLRLTVAWASSALALLLAAAVVAGVDINGVPGAFLVAAIVAVVNAVLPPLVAALRLPFTVLVGFLLVLALDASALLIAAAIILVFLVELPAYRVFFAISLGLGIVIAAILYLRNKYFPVREKDVENKRPLGLD